MWAETLAGSMSGLEKPMNKGLIVVAVLLSMLATAGAFAKGDPPAAPVVVGDVSERMMAPTVMVAGSVVSRLSDF